MKSSHLFQSLDPQTQRNLSGRLRSLQSVRGTSKEGRRLLNNEVLLDHHLKIGTNISTPNGIERWVEFRVAASQIKLKKRDLKLYQKEAAVLSKYIDGAKPRAIAHEMQVLRSFIHRSYTKYQKKRHDFGQWLQGNTVALTRAPPLKLTDNAVILDCIHQSLEAIGIHQVTIADVFKYL